MHRFCVRVCVCRENSAEGSGIPAVLPCQSVTQLSELPSPHCHPFSTAVFPDFPTWSRAWLPLPVQHRPAPGSAPLPRGTVPFPPRPSLALSRPSALPLARLLFFWGLLAAVCRARPFVLTADGPGSQCSGLRTRHATLAGPSCSPRPTKLRLYCHLCLENAKFFSL